MVSLFEWEEPDPECVECQEDGLVSTPGDMHETPPYTGELDWTNDGSELVHPFID